MESRKLRSKSLPFELRASLARETQTSCRSTEAHEACFLSVVSDLISESNGMGNRFSRNTIQLSNCLIPNETSSLAQLIRWGNIEWNGQKIIIKRLFLVSRRSVSIVNSLRVFPLEFIQFFS